MDGFTLSSGIGQIPNIEKFLDVNRLTRDPAVLHRGSCCAVYSWGSKPYSRISAQIADRCSLPHVRLEDGFICSFGNSSRSTKYSIVVDPVGIYYDSTGPSKLENILNGADLLSVSLSDPAQLARASALLTEFCAQNYSKYNHLSASKVTLPSDAILVIDQTWGDQSVGYGGMDDHRFRQMLLDAVERYPAEKVVVKVHPAVLSGKKRGYLTELARELKLNLLADTLSAEQLASCRCVYTGTSLMGMEALLHGVSVKCFGRPFYAGWGVTQDHVDLATRTRPRTVVELFLAAYVLYPTYVDPVSGKRCEIEDILDHLLVQFEQRRRIGKRYTCIGITPWKRRYLDRYLQSADFSHQHIAVSAAKEHIEGKECSEQSLLVWGRKHADTELEQRLIDRPVARMEDGFLRSVGLGSNFTAPRSLVIDDIGIYFDATQPSRLEQLLENHRCTPQQLERAKNLISLLLEHRVSKYSVAANDECADTSFYRNKSPLLVIGQVEGDASLRYGTDRIRSNLQLIQEVRSHHPEAVVIYKPHPDVVSGNRSDGIEHNRKLLSLCDRVETVLPIHVVIRQCEEIHTMTSLAGLEALLMGKKVVTYGKPFYAGWGLTSDHCRFERRTKKLTIQELVYVSYMLYPSYLDIESGEFTSAENTVRALLNERINKTQGSLTASGLDKYVTMVRNIKKGLTYAA